MRIKDYIAIVLTLIFIVSLVGVFKFMGQWNEFGTFWFYAGVMVMSGTGLCQLAES